MMGRRRRRRRRQGRGGRGGHCGRRRGLPSVGGRWGGSGCACPAFYGVNGGTSSNRRGVGGVVGGYGTGWPVASSQWPVVRGGAGRGRHARCWRRGRHRRRHATGTVIGREHVIVMMIMMIMMGVVVMRRRSAVVVVVGRRWAVV